MVTPVHRFQSIESVANNGLRSTRAPVYSPRLPYPQPNHCNGSTSNVRSPNVGRSLEMITNQNQTTTPRRLRRPTSKYKCGMWISFAMFFLFFAGFKYYMNGQVNIGVEAVVFCLFLVLLLVVGGFISLFEAISKCSTTDSPPGDLTSSQPEEQTSSEDANNPQGNGSSNASELPPPPYHIAVMLSPQNELETIQVIRDSPPPSYEKAVT
ncbi:uncharacterized protein LOC109600626 isoform X2 [Aethina tumida]|nr:uncharacterized protein LOC109600626 isoform X2 [Aethina tumida]